MSEPKRPELIAAAKELNTLLDPDPKIKTVGVKTDELTKAIVVAAGLLDKGDSLTTETHAVLCALEVELPEGLVIAAADADDENGDNAQEEKKPEPAIEREDLVALIEEMNKVMDLDPAIEASEKSSIDGLKKLIHDNCYDKGECQVFDTDKFSPEAWETLTVLGVRPVVTKKAKDKPAKAEKAEKPAKAGKAEKAEKPAKAKKEKKEKSPGTPSNKRIVYDLFAAGEKDQAKMLKATNDAVSATTIKIWISMWAKGKNLPAGIKAAE